MLGFLEPDIGTIAQGAAGLGQFLGLEDRATCIALVSQRMRRAALRARPNYEAIGQELLAPAAIGSLLNLGADIAVRIHLKIDLSDEILVPRRLGGRVVVERDSEPFDHLNNSPVIAIGQFRGRDSFLLRLVFNARSVSIGSRDIEDIFAPKAIVAGKHVARHQRTHQVTQMRNSRRIRPGSTHEHSLFVHHPPPSSSD